MRPPRAGKATGILQDDIGERDIIAHLIPAPPVTVAVDRQPHILRLLIVERLTCVAQVDDHLRRGGNRKGESKNKGVEG
jgi:hypothetical protein